MASTQGLGGLGQFQQNFKASRVQQMGFQAWQPGFEGTQNV